MPCPQQAFCNSQIQQGLAAWSEEARVTPSRQLCLFLTLFPVTGCRSWLWCLADCPSHANSNNSSSGKPFRTLPHHKTTAISFIYCILEPTSGLCPTPVSDEICLITSPGHQRKQTIYYCMPISGLGIFPLPYLS